MTGPSPENGLCVLGFVNLEIAIPSDVQQPPIGHEEFVNGLELRLGGALNTASVAHALGWPTLLAFPSSDSPFDHVASEAARAMGLMVLTWHTAIGPPISIAFARGNERSSLSMAPFEAMDDCPQLPIRGWIHVTGLREARRIGPRLADARARGAKVSVVASWTTDELGRLRQAPGRLWDLLFLNKLKSSLDAPEPNEAIERLTAVAREVVVTSAGGSHAYLDGDFFSVDNDPIDHVVDTAGAGDAFCAGFLLARERGANPEAAMQYAGRVATRVLAISGGTVTDPSLFSDLVLPC
jgi:sugar/nucleoside kinase (ribokinase family)